MRYPRGLTETKIKKVKRLLRQFSPLPPKHSERPIGALSLRDIERLSGVSFYTVWCIKQGKYDKPDPLQVKKVKPGFFNVNERWNWLIGGTQLRKPGTKQVA